MFQVRREQTSVLNKASDLQFENEMVLHLKDFAGRHCEVIGEDGVRQVIRLGVTRSKKYGFSQHGSVKFFVELMFMFGSYFDSDVQHPWAVEVLNDRAVSDEMFRARGLHKSMLTYLEQVAGPNHAYTRAALKKTRLLASELGSMEVHSMQPELLLRVENVYPEKCAWLKKDRVNGVIDGGLRVARAKGVTAARGMALFAVLAFALGHGFHEDPLYPWIARTVNGSGTSDPNLAAEKLEAKALQYLGKVLEYLHEA